MAQPDWQLSLGMCNRMKTPGRSHVGTLPFISDLCVPPPGQAQDPQVRDYSQEVSKEKPFPEPGKDTATQTDREIASAGVGPCS